MIKQCMAAILVLLLLFTGVVPASAGKVSKPLDTWKYRNPIPTAEDFKAIVYGDDKFVAVGYVGTIASSSDGTAWTAVDAGLASDFYGVGYGGDLFVAVGEDGAIVTSDDGAQWTSRSSGTSERLNGVAYGNGLFVAVGFNGSIFTSSDGVSWNSKTGGGSTSLFNIAYGNNLFVAIGESGALLTSTDGDTWTSQTSTSTVTLYGIVYNGSMFVAVGQGGKIISSSDGITWASRALSYYADLNTVSYGNGKFVILAAYGVQITSSDGTTWTKGDSITGFTDTLNGLTYGNDIFTAVGPGGAIMASSDTGDTWSHITNGSRQSNFKVAFGDGSYVVVGVSGSILSSTDAITWTSRTSELTSLINGVAYGAGTFVIAGNSGKIATSPDGVTWTSRTSGKSSTLRSVNFINNKFYVVGNNGVILSSTDGIDWSDKSGASTDSLYGIAYGNGTYVAVSENSTVLTSSDGATWTSQTIDPYTSLYGVVYALNKFIAVGSAGSILTSDDGIIWTSQSSGTSAYFYAIAATENVVAVAGSSYLITSSDGISWTKRNAKTYKSINGIGYDGRTLLLVGDGGMIKQSGDFYIVKYDGNGSTSGKAPKDGSIYISSESASVLGNSGNLAKNGGYVFANWNTKADGSGTHYAEGDSLPIEDTNVTLYANWYYMPILYKISYNGNGSTSGSVPIDFGSYASSVTTSVYANSGGLVRTGYTFAGWNTKADGSGTNYSPGSSLTIESTYVILYAQWTIVDSTSNSGGTTTPVATPVTAPAEKPVETPAGFRVIVNGVPQEEIAKASITTDGGLNTLTAAVDTEKLIAQLESEGQSPIIIIPVTQAADKVTALFTGEAVKAMESHQALLQIETPNGNYKLPAAEILISSLSQQFGTQIKLSDIVVQVEIKKSDAAKAELLNEAAAKGGYTVAAAPVDFTVTVSYNGKSISVEKFATYVEREIPLPAGTDPNRITTALVLEADGSTRHIPTYVTTRNGSSYAVANSLTNSTYSLVWNPVTFSDVSGHWAQQPVNDMASRMIVNGVDATRFVPDASITRAEFAAIVVRGLGLADNGQASSYTDLKPNAWYTGAVGKAKEYHLIEGYEDGTFRPDQKVTREEALVILSRAMKLVKLNPPAESATNPEAVLAAFADHKAIASWAQQAAAAAVSSGLVQGSYTKLSPKSEITRAETAAIIQRMLVKANLID